MPIKPVSRLQDSELAAVERARAPRGRHPVELVEQTWRYRSMNWSVATSTSRHAQLAQAASSLGNGVVPASTSMVKSARLFLIRMRRRPRPPSPYCARAGCAGATMSARKPTSTKKASQRRPVREAECRPGRRQRRARAPRRPAPSTQPIGVATTINDEDQGRDQLEPRVEPVQRAGSRAMTLEPLKPHRAWPLRSAELGQDPRHPPGDAKDDQRADQAGGRRRQLHVLQARELELVIGDRRGDRRRWRRLAARSPVFRRRIPGRRADRRQTARGKRPPPAQRPVRPRASGPSAAERNCGTSWHHPAISKRSGRRPAETARPAR